MIAAERVTGAVRTFIQRIRITPSTWIPVLCASILFARFLSSCASTVAPHSDWLQFLGRFHPALLHVPIGLIVLLPLLEIGGAKRSALREAADFVLRVALALALPTFALGYMLAYGAGDTGIAVTRHMWGAVALCIGLMLCLFFRRAWATGGSKNGLSRAPGFRLCWPFYGPGIRAVPLRMALIT